MATKCKKKIFYKNSNMIDKQSEEKIMIARVNSKTERKTDRQNFQRKDKVEQY